MQLIVDTMRKIGCILIVSWLLSGCTLLDAYLLAHYDSNEYAAITAVRAQAAQFKEECAQDTAASNAHAIAASAQYFEYYSQHIPRNTDGVKAATAINEMAQGLRKQYDTNNKVSVAFCKIKYGAIESSAQITQQTIGQRPR